MELAARYDPKSVEEKWYSFWMDNGYFHAEADKSKKPFTIVIPPPNITGSLHMGHALNNVLQDILIRYKKLKGYNTLWVPGTDHGGIATQNVVEKILAREGRSRHDLGRKEFLKKMWEWRAETGDTILMQLEKIGCACDWKRTRFTMDETCKRAVLTAFETLYSQGYIYRGEHIVDWCPRCGTALNESEVEHKDEKGKLFYIRYPLKSSGKDEYLTVATTRPETMLGDTAVAVNPHDKRYKKYIGQKVILPLVNREIPVVADDFVESSFGTGVVKVTPAHDPNDWEIAKRHNLVLLQVIDKNAKITISAVTGLDGIPTDTAEKIAKYYVGEDRYVVRGRIINDLKEHDFLEKEESYDVPITRCYRCDSATEPLISEQWYLKTREMADKAMEVVESNRVRFTPKSWAKPYLKWLANLHDWCISRQIWWGHQIPAWYCRKCNKGKIVYVLRKDGIEYETAEVHLDEYENQLKDTNYYLRPGIKPEHVGSLAPDTCPVCGGRDFIQDPDVLDTWFSSSLWPFSVFKWPEQSQDLSYFYPTSVLATGHEILYLWVARMIMMGLTLMGDIPYSDVYIHGIVRDVHGKKMSKSLGNVIDPLIVTEKYGTDALRFTMAIHGVMGRDLHLSEECFDAYRNFSNKIWNASRFVLMNVKDSSYKEIDLASADLSLADKWILKEYNELIAGVASAIDSFNISESARLLFEFIWGKYCDWYLEMVKPVLYGDYEDKTSVHAVLMKVLEGIMRLLHPIMPFISEEIWQMCPHEEDSIMVSSWPDELVLKQIDSAGVSLQMSLLQDTITAVRNIRGELRIPVGKDINVLIKTASKSSTAILKANSSLIQKLVKAGSIEVGEAIKRPKVSAVAVVHKSEVYVPLEGVVDIDAEKERLDKEIAKIGKEIQIFDKRLSNINFLKKAPPKEVEKSKSRKKEFIEIETRLKQILAKISN